MYSCTPHPKVMLLLMKQKSEANENPFDLDCSNERPSAGTRAGLGQRNTCTQLLLNLAETVSKMPGDSTNWEYPQGEAEMRSWLVLYFFSGSVLILQPGFVRPAALQLITDILAGPRSSPGQRIPHGNGSLEG